MTTIILTIIGILLAAAAALMVIFYGGDAFNSGSTGAAANSFQNAGTNVVVAMQLHKASKGVSPAALTDLTDVSCSSGGSCLKEVPPLPNSVTGVALVHAVSGNLYTVTNVARDVCQRINKNLNVPDLTTVDTTKKMACQLPASGSGRFYATA